LPACSGSISVGRSEGHVVDLAAYIKAGQLLAYRAPENAIGDPWAVRGLVP
jgi:hypothetical protein